MFNDFFNLIFPRLCNACNKVMLKNEVVICTSCIITLPKTNYHLNKDNPLNKIFWGRVEVEMAAAYYSFSKESKVQQLLHNLKYRGYKEVGIKVGELYGHELRQLERFSSLDYIVPIPLHKNKLKKRGFNQSEFFAMGLSKSMDVIINTKDLKRNIDSKTQTKKGRFKRWENVSNIFELDEGSVLEGKKVLVVDDVITTGATMEAAIQVLTQKGCKVFVATIASA